MLERVRAFAILRPATERDLRVFLAVIFLAVLAYALGFVLFVSNLPAAPASPPKADGIVALTGGDERLDTAVALAGTRRGQAAAGQRRRPGDHQGNRGQDVGRRAALSIAAPISAMPPKTPMAMPRKRRDWTREHHFNSLVIVTGRYHMPRTMQEFSAVPAGRDADRLSGGAEPHRSGRLVAASAHRAAAAPRICQISRQPGDHAAGRDDDLAALGAVPAVVSGRHHHPVADLPAGAGAAARRDGVAGAALGARSRSGA